MASKQCQHIQQGAPVAGSFTIPAGPINRSDPHTRLAEPMKVEVCSVCIAQGTGGATQVGKSGGFSVGDSGEYFGSKLS